MSADSLGRAVAAVRAMERSYAQFMADAETAMRECVSVAGPLAAQKAIDHRARLIADVVAAEYRIAPALLFMKVRPARIAEARHIAMTLCIELLLLSQAEVAESFGRDHGAVQNAQRNVRNWSAQMPNFSRRFADIKAACQNALTTLPSSAA